MSLSIDVDGVIPVAGDDPINQIEKLHKHPVGQKAKTEIRKSNNETRFIRSYLWQQMSVRREEDGFAEKMS